MKTILYTGARSGISSFVINRLLSKDYLIYITVHTKSEEKYIKEKYKNTRNIKCCKIDITDDNDLKKIKLLDVDILVANAAVGEGGSLLEIDIDRIRNNFEVNVFSTIKLIQIVLKTMIEKGSGKIVVISSLASTIPIPFLGAYAGSKASLSHMIKILRKEVKLLNKNINIVLVEPGMYHTGFNQVMLDNKYKYMNIESYFNNQINQIRKKENLFFRLLEQYDFSSISNKIYKAITCKYPKKIYRAPFFQSIGAKLYKILT